MGRLPVNAENRATLPSPRAMPARHELVSMVEPCTFDNSAMASWAARYTSRMSFSLAPTPPGVAKALTLNPSGNTAIAAETRSRFVSTLFKSRRAPLSKFSGSGTKSTSLTPARTEARMKRP